MEEIFIPRSVLCAICGMPADPKNFHRNILISNLFFCSQECMDIGCSTVRIQLGVGMAVIIVLLSFWIGPSILPLAIIGLFPVLCGLLGILRCVFNKNKYSKDIELEE